MLLMQLYIAVMADAALLDLNWKYITYRFNIPTELHL